MEVFNFKSADLSKLLPLLSVPLHAVIAVSEKSRSEKCGFVNCKDGLLRTCLLLFFRG